VVWGLFFRSAAGVLIVDDECRFAVKNLGKLSGGMGVLFFRRRFGVIVGKKAYLPRFGSTKGLRDELRPSSSPTAPLRIFQLWNGNYLETNHLQKLVTAVVLGP
jgi:hypothetical protein